MNEEKKLDEKTLESVAGGVDMNATAVLAAIQRNCLQGCKDYDAECMAYLGTLQAKFAASSVVDVACPKGHTIL